MLIIVYDVIFGYVSHLFIKSQSFSKLKEFANKFKQRDHAVKRLLRFRYLPYWHPV